MRIEFDLRLTPLIAAALLALPILLLLRRRCRASSARAAEVRRLLQATAAEDARVEAEALRFRIRDPVVENIDVVDVVDSFKVAGDGIGRMECAVCFSPTSTRCSRCKAVRYCSGRCQILHWRQGHKEECRPPVIGKSDQCDSDLETEGKLPAIPSSESNFSSEIFSEDDNHVVEPFVDAPVTDETLDSSADSLSSTSSGPLEILHDEESHIFDNGNEREALCQDAFSNRPRKEAHVSQKELTCQLEEVNVQENPTSVPSIISELFRNVDPSEDIGGGGCNGAVFDSHEAQSSEEGNHSQMDAGSPLSTSSSQGTPLKSTYTKENSSCKTVPVVSEKVEHRSNGISELKISARKVVQQLKPLQVLTHYPPTQKSDVTGIYKMLFPYDLFIKLYNYKEEMRPCGFTNCGNSCYANAVLQCLAFTKPLRAYLLQRVHSKTCPKTDWCFTCEFESLLVKAKESQSPLSPIAILSHIQSIGSNLGYGSEEDAHEFLRYAIEAMQSVCLKEAGADAAARFAEETTLINLMFAGYLISKVKCMRCRTKSDRHDRMMDLTVEISGDIGTLAEALARYTSTEMLDGENKYKCGRCNSFERAKKKLSIFEAPNILTVVLKRFQVGNFGKLNKAVRFPEFLNLAPYMSGTDDKSPVYSLYAVVVHQDIMNAAFSGHYVCYVRSTQKKWYKIDDSKVKQVDLDRVLSQNAYMLLYARISPRAPSALRNKLMREHTSRSQNMEAATISNGSQNIFKMRSIPRIPRPASSVAHDKSRDQAHWPDQHGAPRPPDLLGGRFVGRNTDSFSDSSSIFSCSDEGSWSTESRRNSTSTDEFSDYHFVDSPCLGSRTPSAFSEESDGYTYSPLASKHLSEAASDRHMRDPSSHWEHANGSASLSYRDRRFQESKDVPFLDRGPPILYSDLPDHSRKLTEEHRSREMQPNVSKRICTDTEIAAQTFCR